MAGLDRFALLLLACQPCQTQLVMHPNQRVHLRKTIRQHANPVASIAPAPWS